jgi:hypothetical protein
MLPRRRGFADAPGPEWTVLVAGARTRLSEADRTGLLHALTRPIDWQLLLELTFHHDLAPLLLHALGTLERPAAVPASLLTTLRRAAAANALRNRLLFEELAHLLDWARCQRIDVIVLKGAALAETVYGNRALRPMRDVDVLVHPEHREHLGELLLSRGYTLERPWAAAEDWHLKNDYHLAYRRRLQGLPDACVELHWDVDLPSRPFRLDLDAVWARAVPARIAGVSASTLCPEDALLHLCLHACKHKLTASLRIYCDIARLAHSGGLRLDWDALVQRAEAADANAFVYAPLLLARDLLDAPVPDAVLGRLRPTSFDPRVATAARQVLGQRPRTASLLPDFYDLTWNASGGARRQAIGKLLSPDVVQARYGLPDRSPRIWWRYLCRVAHLARSYLPDFWHFVRGGRRIRTHLEERALLEQFLQPFASIKRPAHL